VNLFVGWLGGGGAKRGGGGLRRVCIVEKLYKILIISSYKILKFHGILCHWVQEYLTLSCLDCW
jgi:hypothetical protein